MAFHADRLTLSHTQGTKAHSRRDALYREGPADMLKRWALGTAWACRPNRVSGLPNLARMWLGEMMAPDYALPDPEAALSNPPGLAGIVHEFTPARVMDGHRRGLFPFAHFGPLKWWSPPERSLLFFDEIHIAKRLRRQMRQGKHTVTFDKDFEGVIKACSEGREGRWHLTWITPQVMRVYTELFDMGHAHSFEVWNEAGELVGGGYGISAGGSFTTESQFTRETNTSKIGFTVLHWHLNKWGYAFDDGKLMTPTCKDMGFREVPRRDYLARLDRALERPGKSGRWKVEDDLATISEWRPAGDTTQNNKSDDGK
ncbi:MAG: leucyl/phenylalanyl-tRNA--protein transferase [Pseudolabrys sp.]